jgi:hypothetical protein
MIVTLDEAKLYLRIDPPTDVSLDNEINAMILGAERYIEKKTGYLTTLRDKTYYPTDGCVRIYDYPINSIAGGHDSEVKNNYTLVKVNEPVTASVGYFNPDDYPPDLKQAIFQLLKYWYYESEKKINDQMIPDGVHRVIELNKRFLI